MPNQIRHPIPYGPYRRRYVQDAVSPEAELWALIDRLGPDPDRAALFATELARRLMPARSPGPKLALLLPMARQLLQGHPTDQWAMTVVEDLVAELFSMRTALTDLMGPDLDAGEALVVLTRMALDLAGEPPLPDVLKGYGELMARKALLPLYHAIIRRLMAELKGPHRLRPGDAAGEIGTLRALARCLTATGKDDGLRAEIVEAFVERSKRLVKRDFVEALLYGSEGAVDEVERLIWLFENVVGSGNRHEVWASLGPRLMAPTFERDLCEAVLPITVRLSLLARLEAAIAEVPLSEAESAALIGRLGRVGAQMATQAQLWRQLAKSSVPPVQRLQVLLALAAGQTGPSGPVAEMARAEVMTLLRRDEVRLALNTDPEAMGRLKPHMDVAAIAVEGD